MKTFKRWLVEETGISDIDYLHSHLNRHGYKLAYKEEKSGLRAGTPDEAKAMGLKPIPDKDREALKASDIGRPHTFHQYNRTQGNAVFGVLVRTSPEGKLQSWSHTHTKIDPKTGKDVDMHYISTQSRKLIPHLGDLKGDKQTYQDGMKTAHEMGRNPNSLVNHLDLFHKKSNVN